MQKVSSLTPTLRALTVLVVSLAILLSYNFMSAAWTSAPANPPANNTPAPINIGTSTASIQNSGKGAVQFDYLSARDTVGANVEMRSPKYCDLNGENCTGGSGDYSKGFYSFTYSGTKVFDTNIPKTAFCSLSTQYDGGCDSGAWCGISLNEGNTWQVDQKQRGDCNQNILCTYSCVGVPQEFIIPVTYSWVKTDASACYVTSSCSGSTESGTASDIYTCMSSGGSSVFDSKCSLPKPVTSSPCSQWCSDN